MDRMRIQVLRKCLPVLLAATLLLSVDGGAQPGGAQPGPSAAPQSDDAIRQAIRKRFATSKIGANGFQVEVKNGIATLRGEARVPQHKGVATRLAKLAGAREVDNQITISDAARQRRRESPSSKPAARDAGSGQPAASGRGAGTSETVPGELAEAAARADRAGTGEGLTETEPSSPGRPPRFAVKPAAGRGEARSQRRRY